MKLLMFALICCVLIWAAALKAIEASLLKIVACDVGQGDSILIIKGTTQILIDTGPDNSVLNCLGKFMPFWDKEVEAILVSHSDIDHSGGLISILERYKVRNLLTTEVGSDTAYYGVLRRKLKEIGLTPKYLAAYNRFRGASSEFTLIHPSPSFIIQNSEIGEEELFPRKPIGNNSNQFSIVLTMKFHQFEAIFTGDIDQDVSDSLINLKETTLLKVPHHGSKNGMTQSLLTKTDPQYAIISVGKKNRYGHPSPEIIDMLKALKVRILRTDEMSHIIIKTNGRHVWL